MRTVIIAAAFCLASLVGATDALGGLRYVDGKERTAAAFHGQTVVIAYFCGHCPTAAKWLGTDGKAIHDWIEKTKLPVTLVLVTPDFQPNELKDLDRDRGYGMVDALYAYDPVNRQNISLNNILQCYLAHPDGHVDYLSFEGTDKQVEGTVTAQNAGTYRVSPDGVTNPQVKELWWAVERGHPQAIRNLAAAAKNKKSPEGAEAAGVLDRLRVGFAARQDELAAAAPSLAAVEDLERFLVEADGVDTKKAQTRLKELKALKELKDDLRARDIYLQCQQMIASPKPDQEKAGKEGLATLAKKMPSTVYGAKAASESR